VPQVAPFEKNFI